MANEYFEFVNQDSKNANLVQFYTHTVNNALYINFTLLNEDNLEWINSIAANNRIGFFQENILRGSSKILAAFDSEHGFRVETAPNPELVLAQYYEVKFDEELPPDQIPTPPENRGWSPIYEIEYLVYDGTNYIVSANPTAIFCFRLSDWQQGIGQKPSTGYMGVNGLVADVNNAAILTLPRGPRGESTKWTSETTLPTADQVTGDMNLFPSAVSSGLVNYYAADGTTAKTDAKAGDVARWDGSKWIFIMSLAVEGFDVSDVFADMHDGLRDATESDYGKVGIGPDGKLYRVKRTADPGHDAAGTFNAYTHAQYRGVAHNRPSNPKSGEIYYNIRVHQWYAFFVNQVVSTIDAQPITPIQALGANTVWLGEVDDVYQARHAIQDFDNTKAYYAVWNETLYVLNNSTYSAATTGTTYSYKWIESLPDDIVTKEEFNSLVMNKLLPDLPASGSRDDKILRFANDVLGWEDMPAGITAEQIARLLPTFPATGSRDNKVPRFDGNNLVWELLEGTGLTAGQLARLLPVFPTAGSRDNKVPVFSGDTLGWEVLGTGGGGLTAPQVTAIANARAEARFTDTEKTKLANAVIESALETTLAPYGLGFIGIYPRYMRLSDQLEDNIIIAFGQLHEPFDTANRVIVNFGGTIVVRTEWTPTTRFLRFSIEQASITNIRNSVSRDDQHILVEITFYKDGFQSENWVGARIIPVIINRDSAPPDINAIQSQLSRAANWADIPNDTDIPANYIIKHSGRYFGAKIAHTKTASHVAPTGDPTNWIELSNGTATLSAAQQARLLPTLPSPGSRDNKAPVFDGDSLVWEVLSSSGLTSGQLARLLPALPAEGSRATKIPRFVGDTLTWQAIDWEGVLARSDTFIRASAPNNSFGVDGNKWFNLANGKGYIKQSGAWAEVTDFALESELTAIRERLLPTFPATGSRNNKFPIFNNDTLNWETFPDIQTRTISWAGIANNTTVAVGTLVHHGGATFACITQHAKGATGPDGDPTNWIILTNWGGTWSNKWYPPGVFVAHAGNPYVSLQAVVQNDPQPNANNNTKWLRLNTDISALATTTALNTAIADVDKAVFAELTINENITIPQTGATAVPLTYAASLPEEHNSSGIIGRATAGNGITLKAGSYVIDVDMNVDTETSGENARTNVEFTLYSGSTLLKTKRGGYLRSLNVFNEQVANARFTINVASDATVQIRVKMLDNDTGTPTIETQTGGAVTVRRIGS